MRLPRSFFLWGKLKQLKSSLMDSGDGEVAVAQSLRSRLAVRVVSECSAEGVGEWNALGKRAGYCRLFGFFWRGWERSSGGWKLWRGGAG